MAKKTYVGIADAHGIESFIPIEEVQLFILKMRANTNMQRHALVYQIQVTDDQIKTIEKMLAESKYTEALKWIKKNIKDVSIEKGRENSWKMIPNHKLDPWY